MYALCVISQIFPNYFLNAGGQPGAFAESLVRAKLPQPPDHGVGRGGAGTPRARHAVRKGAQAPPSPIPEHVMFLLNIVRDFPSRFVGQLVELAYIGVLLA